MSILFDVNHAGHVHFVKNAYRKLTREGYDCLIVASDKPLVYKLLKEYKLPYYPMGSIGKSLIAKVFKLVVHDIKLLFYCLKHKPKVVLGIVSIRGSHISWLLRLRSIVFTDTEHATKQIALFKPFTTEIHTPNWFVKNLGPKQVRYSGFHELAYLHPDNFTQRSEVISMLGVESGQNYFILRFVAWDATHDKNQYGINLKTKRKILKMLLPYGQVFITSEYDLEEEFKQFEYNIPSSYLHDALSYTSILVSEGATTACEAALLGVPTLYVNSLSLGYITHLEQQHDLLYHLTDQDAVLSKLNALLNSPNLKGEWKEKRDKFVKTQQDTTAYIVDLVKT